MRPEEDRGSGSAESKGLQGSICCFFSTLLNYQYEQWAAPGRHSPESMSAKRNGYKVGSASLANHTIRAHSTQGGHSIRVCLQCVCVQLLPTSLKSLF